MGVIFLTSLHEQIKKRRENGGKRVKCEKTEEMVRNLSIYQQRSRGQASSKVARMLNGASLLVGVGRCSAVGQDKDPYPCAAFGRLTFLVPTTTLKIFLSIPLTKEKHLMKKQKTCETLPLSPVPRARGHVPWEEWHIYSHGAPQALRGQPTPR